MATQSSQSRHVDHISNLPDDILYNILAFIPTKSAVMTSTLSKQWKYLWTKVPVLDFSKALDLPPYRSLNSDQRIAFQNFVDKSLLHNDTPSLRYLCLEIHPGINNLYVESWLSAIAKRKVQKIKVTRYSRGEAYVPLPSGFLYSERLMVLELYGHLSFWSPMPLHLPNLEVIHLYSVELPDAEFVKKLLLGCPVLRDLEMMCCKCNYRTLHVKSSSLEKLIIWHVAYMSHYPQYIIRAPNLRHLGISGGLKPLYVCNLSLLVEADLDIRFGSEHRHKLLKKISRVKTARLEIPERFGRCKLPIFRNLTCLKLYAVCSVGELLRCTPNLKYLFVQYLLDPRPPAYWPESLSSLEKFELNIISYVKEHVALVASFLKVASSLKEMKITTPRLEKNQRITFSQEILALPRSSASCQLEVVGC